jgi:hypothetical protein
MKYRVTIRVPSETTYVYELEAASQQEVRRRFNDLDTDELDPVSMQTCDAIDDMPTIFHQGDSLAYI